MPLSTEPSHPPLPLSPFPSNRLYSLVQITLDGILLALASQVLGYRQELLCPATTSNSLLLTFC